MPNETSQWEAIAQITFERWQFPNCRVTADGKHVALILPFNSGSEFHNYSSFSIVILALVDYNYSFPYVDIGCQGRISNEGDY